LVEKILCDRIASRAYAHHHRAGGVSATTANTPA
jgi:hypothetical protein